jgi:hypothetical protein
VGMRTPSEFRVWVCRSIMEEQSAVSSQQSAVSCWWSGSVSNDDKNAVS